MKKISVILTAVVAALALSFTGCTTGNADADILPAIYVYGWGFNNAGDSFAWNDNTAMTYDLDTGVYSYTFKSTACDGLILLNNAYSDAAKFGGGNLPGISAAGVYEVKDVDNTWYWQKTGTAATIVIKYDPATYTTGLAGADVSTLNSTTAAQVGAEMIIKGSSFGGDVNAEVPFKDGKATYTFVSDGTNDWGQDHFECWGYFQAGDDSTLKVASKQFNAGTTKLGEPVAVDFSATTNFGCSNSGDGTTAGIIYQLVVETTATGATMKLNRFVANNN